jgi:LysR family glycine cleavage system transcriptional activator
MNEASRKLLPPMAALHSFSAAARHGSFSKAAEEVGLTQSAVSRQVAHLEEWLGLALFDRTGRRVALNVQGEAYAAAIAPALDVIRRATAKALAPSSDRTVNLATLPSFGMRWLAPRLPQLTRRHPDLLVNFAARTDEFDFALEPFDAAIHFGRPNWPGVEHDLLFRERSIPVVAPHLIEHYGLEKPADLARLPLLTQSFRQDAWARWFDLAGVSPRPQMRGGPDFAHFLMLAQAAAAGAGAALIPSFLIEPELASGALVQAFDLPMSGQEAYYLVYPPGRRDSPGFRQLRDWIIEESREEASRDPTLSAPPHRS